MMSTTYLKLQLNLAGLSEVLDEIAIFYYIIVFFLILQIVLQNRDPVKTYGYVLILIFLPILGILVYIFFGQDYRQRKFYKRKRLFDQRTLEEWNNRIIDNVQKVKDNPLLKYRKLGRALYTGSGSYMTTRNKFTYLASGKEYFDHLFIEIENAKDHIHIEMYMMRSDVLFDKVCDALIRARERGVLVRIVYDVGGSSGLKRKTIKRLKHNGIQIEPFFKVWFPFLALKTNYRDHTKLIIIDSEKYFTGGINLDSRYNDEYNDRHWADVGVIVEGEGAIAAQNHFLLVWEMVTKEKLSDVERYLNCSPVESNGVVQFVSSGPDSTWPAILHMFNLSIDTAADYIYLQTPYFTPENTVLHSLVCAAMGGVDVRLMIPNDSDSNLVDYASRSFLEPLLNAGVKVYLYEKGMLHAKQFVVDDIACFVGTSNMDVRSFYYNFECGALMYDETVALKVKQLFLEQIKDSIELNAEIWQKRPRYQRVFESFGRIFSPLF